MKPQDPMEEEFLAMLREEIRLARASKTQRIIEALVKVQDGRVVHGAVKPPWKVTEAE